MEWYELIKKRRDWSSIYRSINKDHFLKIWPKEVIQHEKRLYENLGAFINVPKVLSYEEELWIANMCESSVWDRIWKDIFSESIDTNGVIPHEVFNTFAKQVSEFLDCTIHMWSEQIKWFDVWWEPFSEIAKEDRIDKEFVEKIHIKVESILNSLPTVWCHWDFNAHNFSPWWIFDLEDSHMWPYWYDLFSCFTHIYRFPIWNHAERNRTYTFTKDQLDGALKLNSKHLNFLNKEVFWALFLLRWAWACQKMSERPFLASYRYKKFISLSNKFLMWEDIYDEVLNTFNSKRDW